MSKWAVCGQCPSLGQENELSKPAGRTVFIVLLFCSATRGSTQHTAQVPLRREETGGRGRGYPDFTPVSPAVSVRRNLKLSAQTTQPTPQSAEHTSQSLASPCMLDRLLGCITNPFPQSSCGYHCFTQEISEAGCVCVGGEATCDSKNQRKWTLVVYVYNFSTCRPRQGDCLNPGVHGPLSSTEELPTKIIIT